MNDNEDLITLKVPAAAEYIDLVRLTLYGLAAKIGFSYEEIEDMKVAVSEACNNAVLHAYGDMRSRAVLTGASVPQIEVRFVKKYDALSIIVKDEGSSFDAAAAAKLAQPVDGQTIDELQAGGLGLYLMQALMDDVIVSSEMGTEVVLTKRLLRSGDL
ncbi:anti-sigma B factor RsbW [Paenibacillus sp. OV219]|uniref:anti-sigma B factor RsbW n=1 Tax=Paenibacillus sp. OV219 TaxID=1884377 RepID=UPI0008AD098B|nr:anti-sigma B factor RsbW [Paenibacillus sp. OV219]SEO50226.1 serine/threonine-protein kinase RsbW [Paenibacillus sp. OV219]